MVTESPGTPVVVQLWQCPRCEVYLSDVQQAREHCTLFSLYECGSQVCEHLTESDAVNCHWRVNPERVQGQSRKERGGMSDTLPSEIKPGTKALFYDPAGARNRNGNDWCPVTLTGEQGKFRDGSRWVEVETSGGRGRDLDARQIRLA